MATEIKAVRNGFGNKIELAIFDVQGREAVGFVGRLQFDKFDEGECTPNPSATISKDAAQKLMDDLWECGLRPSEGTGSAGSLAATERHLKDMQAIAKGLLKKDGVEV